MTVVRFVLFLLTIFAPLAAAGAPLADPEPQHASHEDDQSLVDVVRQATAIFRDVRQAGPAGYGETLGCVSGPEDGAMGVHFVNSTLLQDGGMLDPHQPEALIYEFRDGVARLVAAEYIVFAEDWHKTHAPNDPPVLDGQLLHYYDAPNRFGLPAFYELHVWAWRDNPHGTFVDWNPRVSCEGR
jgi:hypothetical protein